MSCWKYKSNVKPVECKPATCNGAVDLLVALYRRLKKRISGNLSKRFNLLSKRTQLLVLVLFCLVCCFLELRQVYSMLVLHTKNKISITVPGKIPMPNMEKDSLVILDHIYKTFQKQKDYDTTLDNY